jgi:GxxExxY protein
MDTDETQMGLTVAELPSGLPHGDLTEAIIGAAFEVHNQLGYGFLERVYKRALQVELLKRGVSTVVEQPITVRYKGAVVGDDVADLVVAECVVLELKISAQYDRRDEAQLLNELKATGMTVGLLLNFGRTKLEFKRLVF